MKTNTVNSMRLRNIFISSFMKGVERARNESWQTICEDFLEEHNELNKTDHIAFRVDGQMYPPRAVELNRKSLLYRKSAELHEDILDSFDLMYGRYITEWEAIIRSFKNMLTVVFREAKTIEEMGLVIPSHIMNMVPDDVEFVALNTAKGISQERAEEISKQYALAFNVENFISVSKLL